ECARACGPGEAGAAVARARFLDHLGTGGPRFGHGRIGAAAVDHDDGIDDVAGKAGDGRPDGTGFVEHGNDGGDAGGHIMSYVIVRSAATWRSRVARERLSRCPGSP